MLSYFFNIFLHERDCSHFYLAQALELYCVFEVSHVNMERAHRRSFEFSLRCIFLLE